MSMPRLVPGRASLSARVARRMAEFSWVDIVVAAAVPVGLRST